MTESQLQTIAKKKLLDEGYTFWFPPRTWGERDVMGVFDFIAAKGRKVMFVQITTIQHVSDRHKKILNFYDLNNVGPFPNVFVWAYNPKKAAFKIRRVI